ncbi:MAG: alpha-2-macroglobulin family protein [Cognatishimia sp.]|nr:alpha-2-macroglobulin family protein [Cognatishimia sp.]
MRFLVRILAILSLVTAAHAQEQLIPERWVVVSPDTDFYGADLTPMFDTSYEACINACLADAACAAFTYNNDKNACFPKTGVDQRDAFEGATSAEVFTSRPDVRAAAKTRRAELNFLSDGDLFAAYDLATRIGRLHASGPWTVDEMIDAMADRRSRGQFDSAMRWAGGVVAKTDSADLWLQYAQLNLSIRENGQLQNKHRNRAFSAMINAYLRGTSPAFRASVLGDMAQILPDLGRGRDSIDALRLAQATQPRLDFETDLNDAIAKYGFRITDSSVDSDAASPRICAQFSEPLRKSGVDYSPFVKRLDQRLAVVAEGNQLCVSGLTHGERYTLTFREGLPAESGEALVRDISLNLYVRDRTPALRFLGRAYVLPRTADAGIPIETVNLDNVELTLRQVSDRNLLRAIQDSYFGQPLSVWQERTFDREIAETVWTGTGQVENTLNQDMLTRLPVGDIINELDPGIYALTAAIPGDDPYEETDATQWFVLSDLGVTTMSGADGLHVVVQSLSDVKPVADTKVTLLSRANRVLSDTLTDSAGYARFDAGLTRGTGGASPALLLLEQGDDIAFLSLTDPAFDLSDRGVEGRPPAPPLDLFVTTDRGAYRAGETIYATALLRGDQAEAIQGLPITAIIKRPDGVEYTRTVSTEDQAGGRVFEIPVASSAPRGSYAMSFYSDTKSQALAVHSVLVEDFIPERIDFDLSLPEGPLRLGDRPPLTVAAKYLFGAPGADLPVDGQITLSAQSALEGHPGYRFGRYDEAFSPRTNGFGQERTDAGGRITVEVPLPEAADAAQPLVADLTVWMSEGSGRPVERRISTEVIPNRDMIGIKPLFDDIVAENSEARFDVISLDSGLNRVEKPVTWTLNRVHTRYQWYQLYGNWNWEPVTRRERIASGDAMLGADPLRVSAPVEWGQYELVVESTEGPYTAGSIEFFAGWYAPADVSETPDTLELALDKDMYRPGETAQLRIVPRAPGTALVSVVSNRLIAMQTVEVGEGATEVDIPVTDDWGSGAYVTASLVRPMDVDNRLNPSRALGLSYAKVDPGAKLLQVALNAPDQMEPNAPLTVGIGLDGVGDGENAYVTLAAVDVGILNLTGFESPDPAGHYFGQRRLGMEIRDIYGRLINGMNGAMGSVRSGGDAMSQAWLQSPPPTEELVAFFSGPIAVDANGQAEVSFDMPDFNGTVKLMAVAWSASAVGQADREVLVRNPIVLSASLPRFLAPGDTSRLLLEVTHAEGPAGRVGLDVFATGGVQLDLTATPRGVDLAALETQKLVIPITADSIGDHLISVALTTPGGKLLAKDLTLPVRLNDPEIGTTQRLTLAAGDTFAFDQGLFADFRPGTGSSVVSAGPLARFDAPGLLAALDRYPYGCIEQITSGALPLLYFDDLSAALGLGDRDRIQERVDQAIAQILTRQSSNGAFGLWRPGTGDLWLDAYVSDFLSRARAQGFDVPQLAFRQALDNLRNRVNFAPDFDSNGGPVAYALMVLAREGAAAIGDLRYYADVKAEAFDTPLAAAQLGAALAFYGDQLRSDQMFASAARQIASRTTDETAQLWRADYGSNLRDAAGLLSLAVDAGSNVVNRNALAQRVATASRSMSTQESAWSLMAAHALVKDPSASELSVNGALLEGPFLRTLDDTFFEPVEITNTSAQPTYVTVTTVGVPDYEVPKGGYGYAISREYFTMEGAPIDPDLVRVGDRFVTLLRVKPFEKGGARLMVNDPLPAGFEIDNPNLLRSGDLRELSWLELNSATHTEFRSDRFLAAVDWRSDDAFQLAYVVRAVSPGDFHHPAASVEDMYNPRYRARTETGRLLVAQ